MTAALYAAAVLCLAWAVRVRVRAVRRYRAERLARLRAVLLVPLGLTRQAPVITERYVGTIPKPLTMAQIKAIADRHAVLYGRTYKPTRYTD